MNVARTSDWPPLSMPRSFPIGGIDASLTEAERADIVAEAALTFEEATRKQLLKEVDDTRKAKAKEKQDDPAAERLANQHFVVALDNAIARGLGLEGLRHFMPRLRCEPLAANERRYLVAHKTGSQQVAKVRTKTPRSAALR